MSLRRYPGSAITSSGLGSIVTVTLPPEVREEIRAEAKRLERSFCWVARRAWEMAKEELRSKEKTDGDK